MSYIAGTIQGNPGTSVWINEPGTRRRKVTSAKDALEANSVDPIELGPKVGLSQALSALFRASAPERCLIM